LKPENLQTQKAYALVESRPRRQTSIFPSTTTPFNFYIYRKPSTAYKMPSYWNRGGLLYFMDATRGPWCQKFSEGHLDRCLRVEPEHPDGAVHRIFARSNFSRLSIYAGLNKPVHEWLDPEWTISQTFYDRIRPALVLATRILEENAEFLDRIVYGKIGHRDGKLTYFLEHQLTKEQHVFPDAFDYLYNFQIFTGHCEPDAVDNWYAFTKAGQYPKLDWKHMETQAVQINNRFMTAFSDYNYDTLAPKLKERLLVTLAFTLVHEMVHICANYKRIELLKDGRHDLVEMKSRKIWFPEPLLTADDDRGELGEAWEHLSFGGMANLFTVGSQEEDAIPILKSTHLACLQRSTAAEGGNPPTTKEIDAASFLNDECWQLFRMLRSGELASTYKSVIGTRMLEQMETAAFMEQFRQVAGRYPSPTEIKEHQNQEAVIRSLVAVRREPCPDESSPEDKPIDYSAAWLALGNQTNTSHMARGQRGMQGGRRTFTRR
jgi:hypothetical protein